MKHNNQVNWDSLMIYIMAIIAIVVIYALSLL